jgi:hypothetical protein
MYCLCVNVYCTVLLPAGVNPIAVNKYMNYINNSAAKDSVFSAAATNLSITTQLHSSVKSSVFLFAPSRKF